MNSPFIGGDNFFRSLGTCTLGFFFYCSVSLFAFVVGLVGRCRCLRLLSDWLGVVVCACCRIGWVVLFALAFGFIVWCWRECRRHDTPAKPRVARVPKARTEPWVNTYTKNKSSVGAALSTEAFVLCRCCLWLCIRWESAAPLGLNIC